MESVALLSDTNWKLNMRRRELIKPDLNPPIHGCARKILHLPQNCFGMTSPNISRICLRQKRWDNKCTRLPHMPTIGALHTLNGGDLQGSSHVIGAWFCSQILTSPAFFGARPFDTKHLWEKNHNHKQQNSIHVAAPPCKQASKFGPRDEFSAIVDTELISHLVLNFKAGCVKDHIENWRSVTSDPVILDAIKYKHHHIEVEGGWRPVQATKPIQIKFSSGEKEIISAEITKLLSKGVIELTKHLNGDFMSTIFVRPKKDGSYRLILNLKPLNEFVSYYHFKMDNIHTLLKLMRPGCFMASVNLKDAHYSIPIASEDQQLLKFELGELFSFYLSPKWACIWPQNIY